MKIELDTEKLSNKINDITCDVVEVSNNVFTFSKSVVVKSINVGKRLNKCIKVAVNEYKKEKKEEIIEC